jgi:hypothetical protein
MRSAYCWVPLALVSLVVPPLMWLFLAGVPLGSYLEFPPLTRHVRHPGFELPVFVGLALVIAAVLAPAFIVGWRAAPPAAPRTTGRFPRWGWGGVALLAAAWFVAWTRVPVLAPVQAHTFLPLWLGYIVTVNALLVRRSRWSLLTHARAYLASLFVLSAVFWWYFEYANRYVQNWYYVGIERFSPAEYLWFATASFSTVLPAVVSTALWLGTFPRLTAPFAQRRPFTFPWPRAGGLALWIAAMLLLAGLSRYPALLFPTVWVAPLLVVTGLRAALGLPTVFAPLARGDYRVLVVAPLAALVCGLFWELWNSRSLAHWEYAIPYVQRFHVFEMPLLGYAGYLPFGLECLAIAALADRHRVLMR